MFTLNLGIIGGAGYVGLISGIGFARLGHQVTGIDVDHQKIASLKKGHCPIYEEGLEEALRQQLETGRLRLVSEEWDRVRDADLIFVTVGSPAQHDGDADLSQIREAAEHLADPLGHYTIIVIKSTLPLDSQQLMRGVLSRHHKEGQDFDIVINPEFLREGQGLYDFFHPTRIVVGTESERARQVMRELYAPFTSADASDMSGGSLGQQVPLLETSLVDALLIKYAANAYLATRISFINDVAGVCERVGANITEVAKGLGYDPRIGQEYLQAGIGFGGPCLEKDLTAFIHFSQKSDYEPRLLQAVLDLNDRKAHEVAEKTKGILGGDLSGKHITVFGLAFKAGTNDVRGSLSLRIMGMLMQAGATVCGHDPVAIPEAKEVLPQATYCEDPYQAVQDADAILVFTDWPQYQQLSYQKIASSMRTPNLLDGRNALDPDGIKRLGFNYWSIGRTV